MHSRWLIPPGVLLLVCAIVDGGDLVPVLDKDRARASKPCAGYLLASTHAASDDSRFECLPYHPQAGDIVLCDNFNKFHHLVYKLAHTEAPMHASIVIAREDGTPALLEMTGPMAISAKVMILDVAERLTTYPGSVMVRRLREPLTPEQSHELTCFAQLQVGKRFAVPRILLQATPFNPHKGMRRTLFGRTYLNRKRWFCSEMVVAAGTTAHLFNPQLHPANATYPRDLAFDDTMDLSGLYYSPLPWSAEKVSSTR